VVAGGREPYWWEAYTEESRLASMRYANPVWQPPPSDNFVPHRYLHTISTAPGSLASLTCCYNKGCWKSRIGVKKAGDRHSVCQQQVKQGNVILPACLQKITPQHVLESVQWYYDKGIISKGPTPDLVVTMPVESIQAEPALEVVKPVTRSTRGDIHLYEGELAGLRPEAESLRGTGWVAVKGPHAAFRLDDWEKRVGEELAKHPDDVFGMIVWSKLTDSQAKQLKRPAQLHPLNHRQPVLNHPVTSWIVLPSDLLPQLPWDKLVGEDKDVQLGLWLYNAGIRLRDGAWVLKGIPWLTSK
jgi:hypothetical protein